MRAAVALLLCCLTGLTLVSQHASAQTPATTTGLGPVYESPVGGFSLRPPAGSQTLRHNGTDPMVEFVNRDESWRLTVSRFTLDRPIDWDDSRTAAGEPVLGMLSRQVADFQDNASDVQVLRLDRVNLENRDMGMVAMRYGLPLNRRLLQRAIIQDAGRVYFILNFTSLSNTELPDDDEPIDADDAPIDPLEAEAVDVFNQVVDSVVILDRSAIRQDQDKRVANTRDLFPGFNQESLTNALLAERWLRIIRNGRDIGFTHVTELPHTNASADGVLIKVRTRTFPDDDSRVDMGTSQFVSFNLRHEIWSSDAVVKDADQSTTVSEQGTADRRVRRELQQGNILDPGQPAEAQINVREEYNLTVSRFSSLDRGDSTPVEFKLPNIYLPQAVGHLLPRLLPRDTTQAYLFVSFISDEQQLMFRYIDVEPNVTVTIDGQSHQATAIHDRIGLEGTATIHYVSPAGEPLGSYSELTSPAGDRTTLWVLPTSYETIEKMWKEQQDEQ